MSNNKQNILYKNPLLSSTLTVDDLIRDAILVRPASVPRETSDDAKSSTNIPLSSPPTMSSSAATFSNVDLSNKNNNTAPYSTAVPGTKDRNENIPNVNLNDEDDFDFASYYARLHSIPDISNITQNTQTTTNTKMEKFEEFAEIDLQSSIAEDDEFLANDDHSKQSYAADLASNLSQLPNVLPHVANTVFSSFTSIWNKGMAREEDQGRDDRNIGLGSIPVEPIETQNVETFEGPVVPIPLLDTTNYSASARKPSIKNNELLQESKENVDCNLNMPPTGGAKSHSESGMANVFRISSSKSKKMYAKVPGLTLGETEYPSQKPHAVSGIKLPPVQTQRNTSEEITQYPLISGQYNPSAEISQTNIPSLIPKDINTDSQNSEYLTPGVKTLNVGEPPYEPIQVTSHLIEPLVNLCNAPLPPQSGDNNFNLLSHVYNSTGVQQLTVRNDNNLVASNFGNQEPFAPPSQPLLPPINSYSLSNSDKKGSYNPRSFFGMLKKNSPFVGSGPPSNMNNSTIPNIMPMGFPSEQPVSIFNPSNIDQEISERLSANVSPKDFEVVDNLEKSTSKNYLAANSKSVNIQNVTTFDVSTSQNVSQHSGNNEFHKISLFNPTDCTLTTSSFDPPKNYSIPCTTTNVSEPPSTAVLPPSGKADVSPVVTPMHNPQASTNSELPKISPINPTDVTTIPSSVDISKDYSIPSTASNVSVPPKTVIPPPSGQGENKFRLSTKKRVQYYAGPISGDTNHNIAFQPSTSILPSSPMLHTNVFKPIETIPNTVITSTPPLDITKPISSANIDGCDFEQSNKGIEIFSPPPVSEDSNNGIPSVLTKPEIYSPELIPYLPQNPSKTYHMLANHEESNINTDTQMFSSSSSGSQDQGSGIGFGFKAFEKIQEKVNFNKLQSAVTSFFDPNYFADQKKIESTKYADDSLESFSICTDTPARNNINYPSNVTPLYPENDTVQYFQIQYQKYGQNNPYQESESNAKTIAMFSVDQNQGAKNISIDQSINNPVPIFFNPSNINEYVSNQDNTVHVAKFESKCIESPCDLITPKSEESHPLSGNTMNSETESSISLNELIQEGANNYKSSIDAKNPTSNKSYEENDNAVDLNEYDNNEFKPENIRGIDNTVSFNEEDKTEKIINGFGQDLQVPSSNEQLNNLQISKTFVGDVAKIDPNLHDLCDDFKEFGVKGKHIDMNVVIPSVTDANNFYDSSHLLKNFQNDTTTFQASGDGPQFFSFPTFHEEKFTSNGQNFNSFLNVENNVSKHIDNSKNSSEQIPMNTSLNENNIPVTNPCPNFDDNQYVEEISVSGKPFNEHLSSVYFENNPNFESSNEDDTKKVTYSHEIQDSLPLICDDSSCTGEYYEDQSKIWGLKNVDVKKQEAYYTKGEVNSSDEEEDKFITETEFPYFKSVVEDDDGQHNLSDDDHSQDNDDSVNIDYEVLNNSNESFSFNFSSELLENSNDSQPSITSNENTNVGVFDPINIGNTIETNTICDDTNNVGVHDSIGEIDSDMIKNIMQNIDITTNKYHSKKQNVADHDDDSVLDEEREKKISKFDYLYEEISFDNTHLSNENRLPSFEDVFKHPENIATEVSEGIEDNIDEFENIEGKSINEDDSNIISTESTLDKSSSFETTDEEVSNILGSTSYAVQTFECEDKDVHSNYESGANTVALLSGSKDFIRNREYDSGITVAQDTVSNFYDSNNLNLENKFIVPSNELVELGHDVFELSSTNKNNNYLVIEDNKEEHSDVAPVQIEQTFSTYDSVTSKTVDSASLDNSVKESETKNDIPFFSAFKFSSSNDDTLFAIDKGNVGDKTLFKPSTNTVYSKPVCVAQPYSMTAPQKKDMQYQQVKTDGHTIDNTTRQFYFQSTMPPTQNYSQSFQGAPNIIHNSYIHIQNAPQSTYSDHIATAHSTNIPNVGTTNTLTSQFPPQTDQNTFFRFSTSADSVAQNVQQPFMNVTYQPNPFNRK